jgi:hypothetical protein
MPEITITDAVKEQLRSALLEGEDLIAGVQQQDLQDDPESAAEVTASLTLAVRRKFDPETAELREIEVRMRRVESGLEIYKVSGLES